MRWGYPPEPEDCTSIDTPDGLVMKISQAVVNPRIPGMHVKLGKPAPRQVITRQLLRRYNFGRDGAFMVTVPRYGTFRCDKEGWCWDGFE